VIDLGNRLIDVASFGGSFVVFLQPLLGFIQPELGHFLVRTRIKALTNRGTGAGRGSRAKSSSTDATRG